MRIRPIEAYFFPTDRQTER